MPTNNSITAIPGIRVGHAHDEAAATGCTVILAEKGAVASVDQRGGAPGTRETDLLRPGHLVNKVHAIMLSGGSAFGLDAANGAMRYLEERKVGLNVGVARVPIVPSAILFDLGIGSATRRPDTQMGYEACMNASAAEPAQGNAGAGMGATVGKLLGMGQAVKAGIGNALVDAGGGVKVGALIAVNTFGDVIGPDGEILAGVRSIKKGPLKIGKGMFADSMQVLRTAAGRSVMGLAQGSNTVIGVVATNAQLDKEGASKVAAMASNGLARCLRPANTMLDGDTIFALSSGRKAADVSIVGAFAAEAVVQAVYNAVQAARGLAGVPSLHELGG